jgi:Protein of unknown function (DUF3147)
MKIAERRVWQAASEELMEYAIRFAVGGLLVCLFAAIGDALRPKSFAGIFCAAPSVSLATLSLTIAAQGKSYASIEARSMIIGAFALLIYSCVCVRLMGKYRIHAFRATSAAIGVWLACAIGIWALALR